MADILEGGCRVIRLREGRPDRHGTLKVWSHVGRGVGARHVSLRVLEFSPGPSTGLRNQSCDEVLYALEGRAIVHINGQSHDVTSDTGIFLPQRTWLAVENKGPEPFVLVGSRCPEPDGPGELGSLPTAMPSRVASAGGVLTVRLSDQEKCPTGDRWYRVMVDSRMGSEQVTQFVGSIPPGRAPDHHHHYEEILCVLRGKGLMWAGRTSAPIGPGSCIYLPRGQVHCVENTGEGELRLLGVFYPAGSPAVRYGDE